MRYVYLKPELKDLSQGSRIAFAREFRYLTQDNVSDKLGLTGECKRRSMARYERGDRVPKEERLQEIANILNINVKCLKEYDFKNEEEHITILQVTHSEESAKYGNRIIRLKDGKIV